MNSKATNYSSVITIPNTNALLEFSNQLIPHISTPLIIGLNGPMGSGKTTFVRHFGKAIGSDDWINSPTYAIIQKYQAPTIDIVHIDLYRTTSEPEIDYLNIPDLINKSSLVFIEWIEKTTLLQPDITFSFSITKTDQRQIHLSSNTYQWIEQIK